MAGTTVACCLIGSWVFASSGSFTARVEQVVDGDSLMVRRGDRLVAVRLYGIDCPEWGQPFGPEATRATAALAESRIVSIEVRGTDDYDRVVAEVVLPDGSSLNRELVRAGQAWWYRHYAPGAEFEQAEDEARAAGRGLWGGSEPIPPWVWRRRHPRGGR